MFNYQSQHNNRTREKGYFCGGPILGLAVEGSGESIIIGYELDSSCRAILSSLCSLFFVLPCHPPSSLKSGPESRVNPQQHPPLCLICMIRNTKYKAMEFRNFFCYWLKLIVLSFFLTEIVVATEESELAVRDRDDGEVFVSFQCAATLLVAGGAVGGTAAYSLSKTLLSIIGFTSVGVSSGSFAAWWQSTMASGIAAGSLFATMQAIAMSGVGQYVLISSSIGGAGAANKFRYVCNEIDKVDVEEVTAKVRSGISQAEYVASEAQKALLTTWETAKDIGETVSAKIDVEDAKDKMQSAMTQAQQIAIEVEKIMGPTWNSVKEMGEAATSRISDEFDKVDIEDAKDKVRSAKSQAEYIASEAKQKMDSSWESLKDYFSD